MIKLNPGKTDGIKIRPRWPSSQVNIDEDAFRQLQEVQSRMPAQVQLILTRGYEPPHTKLGGLRRLFRRLGIGLFHALYYKRREEIIDIFGANGHDIDGTHIDVSIEINDRRLRLLRLGVFTPRSWQKNAVKRHQPFVSMVKSALMDCGFHIHRNETESLQIHCDLVTHSVSSPQSHSLP
jgi:hypothetical protein